MDEKEKIFRSTWEYSDWGRGIRKSALSFEVEEHALRYQHSYLRD